jgi:PHS family inorganic phosphate transporter-like MFS transporter
VFFIDRIGRFIIQLGGFLLMSIFMAILGFKYGDLRGEKNACGPDSKKDFCGGHPIMFTVLYGLTFFFANFGPNSTTFIVPAELFPARFRSTCHGISAASGKAGAIIGAFVVQYYTQDGDSNGIKKAIIGLSVVNLIGFFFTFLVPETKGKSLEELSGEDQDIGKNAEANGKNYRTDVGPESEMV